MKRLILESVSSLHAGEMFPILSDRTLYHFTGGEPPESVESVRRWFTSLETRKSPDGTEHWLTWIVRLKKQNVAIGYVQATIKEEQADAAWLIGRNWQGCGYAKEAVALLKYKLIDSRIKRVTAHIHPDHRASQQVASAIGFLNTGDRRDGEEVWEATLVAG